MLAVLSAAALVFSLVSLAGHITRYHEQHPPSLHYFLPITTPGFVYADRAVTVTDRIGPDGDGVVEVAYGPRTVEIPIAIPLSEPQRQLPPIIRHADWFRMLLYREGEGFDRSVIERLRDDHSVRGELVAVARRVRPGVDPRTYGEVFRSDWLFDFYVFMPDGTWTTERLAFPESDRSLARRQREAKRQGDPVPQRDDDELVEGTWQFEAAMQVMPPGSAPKHAFTENALASAGWRWPLAGLSLMSLMFSVAIAIAPSKSSRRASTHHAAADSAQGQAAPDRR